MFMLSDPVGAEQPDIMMMPAAAKVLMFRTDWMAVPNCAVLSQWQQNNPGVHLHPRQVAGQPHVEDVDVMRTMLLPPARVHHFLNGPWPLDVLVLTEALVGALGAQIIVALPLLRTLQGAVSEMLQCRGPMRSLSLCRRQWTGR